MAITNGYATLTELKARLDIDDSSDDTILENVIEAASRQIDGLCGRRFYAASETRYYTADMIDVLFVDDILSVTTLKTDEDGDRVYETTWSSSTDYELEPVNAATIGEPYNAIYPMPDGLYLFPTHRRGVEVAGSFGYASTTPDAINEACLILSARIFKRKDAPFGIAGSAGVDELRMISARDPDVKALVEQYRKFGVWSI